MYTCVYICAHFPGIKTGRLQIHHQWMLHAHMYLTKKVSIQQLFVTPFYMMWVSPLIRESLQITVALKFFSHIRVRVVFQNRVYGVSRLFLPRTSTFPKQDQKSWTRLRPPTVPATTRGPPQIRQGLADHHAGSTSDSAQIIRTNY